MCFQILLGLTKLISAALLASFMEFHHCLTKRNILDMMSMFLTLCENNITCYEYIITWYAYFITWYENFFTWCKFFVTWCGYVFKWCEKFNTKCVYFFTWCEKFMTCCGYIFKWWEYFSTWCGLFSIRNTYDVMWILYYVKTNIEKIGLLAPMIWHVLAL